MRKAEEKTGFSLARLINLLVEDGYLDELVAKRGKGSLRCAFQCVAGLPETSANTGVHYDRPDKVHRMLRARGVALSMFYVLDL